MENKQDVLNSVDNVRIDEGEFKYILVKVYDPDNEFTIYKYIVRGTATAKFHDDIYEDLTPQIEHLGLECECVGGGKIEHNPEDKSIKVYGSSQKYGKADHERVCKLLRKKFRDYDVCIPDEE